jgi:AraC-like DNA-binding protein
MIRFYRDKDLPFFELKTCDTSELSYKRHAHEEYSIGIVDQGRSNFWYAGKIEEIGPKTVVFLPPDLVHSCNPIDQTLWKYKMLYINKKWIQDFIKSKNEISFTPVVKDVSGCKIFDLVNKMVKSLNSSATPLEKEANVLALFEQSLSGEKKTCKVDDEEEQPKLKIIKEYLQSCFAEKITLDQLEAVSGISKFHIVRLFKREFTIPPHAYQTLLRVNYAKKELRRNKPVLEVTYEAGFYDQSHFIKVFKNYTGTTPDRYQKLT